jgi:aminobenzoyl-glutamate utilization protein B
LDGVEAMDVMVNMMREHVSQETRIHYVITKGGEAPNVVPAFAEVYYYVRHPDRSEVKAVWERIVNASKGAALGTDTKVEVEITGGVHDLLPNETLAKVMYTNLKEVGGYTMSPEELAFGTEIQKSFTGKSPALSSTQEIAKYELREGQHLPMLVM